MIFWEIQGVGNGEDTGCNSGEEDVFQNNACMNGDKWVTLYGINKRQI